MNRLWIRLSLTFVLTLLLAGVVGGLIFMTLRSQGFIPYPVPEELTPEAAAQLREIFERSMPRELLRSTLATIIVGIIAGVWASLWLARPLQKLEEGATAFGPQNLDYRVEVDPSTAEVAAVAEAFNQMADRLERAEKMRQNLLADVAHELRTPLSVVQGNLQAILDEVYPLSREEIGRLYEQTRHLSRLVEDLHELTLAEAHQLPLNREEIAPAALVNQAAAVFRPMAAERQVHLRAELLGKLPAVSADPARLTQALQNLLSNALRHTPAGGEVTIQAEAGDGRLSLRVIDSGAGIPPEHLPYVFDRFYRPDASRTRYADQSGAGLGLAIVKAIAEAHDGAATVASDGPGQGTTFTLSLPLQGDPARGLN